MAELFAFNVAVLEPDVEPDALGHYDPEKQQFVWAGDGEVNLGWALCTRGVYGWSVCNSTGTSCNFSYGNCDSPGFSLCYVRCDYG